MFRLTRTQLFLYSLIAIAVVVIGVGAIGSGGGSAEPQAMASGTPDEGFEVDTGSARLVVHVTGAVRRPGVYGLPSGSRVNDAIAKAGGVTGKGLLELVNLAAPLADGQQVVVPAAVDVVGGPGETGAAGVVGAGGASGNVSLATATAADLEALDGIGPATAAKIIAFRQERGGVVSVEQLDEIHGIGPATVELLRSQLGP